MYSPYHQHDIICLELGIFFTNDEQIIGKKHFIDENPEVSKIKNLVKEIHSEIKKDEFVKISNEFIDCINKNEFALAEMFKNYKFSKELFQYIDNQKLFETIIKIDNKKISNFNELLRNRYEVGNIGGFLFEDFEKLAALNKNLTDYLDKNLIEQPRKFLLDTLNDITKDICKHLETTKKI